MSDMLILFIVTSAKTENKSFVFVVGVYISAQLIATNIQCLDISIPMFECAEL